MPEDYCTGVPDGDWGQACEWHDSDYKTLWVWRKEADDRFRDRLKQYNRYIAILYYYGVRIFGRLFV